MTIAWLLDVDGVINVWRQSWAAEPTYVKAGRTYINYNQEAIKFIRGEILPLGVQIVWCTTWNYYATELHALEELLGISGQRGFVDSPSQHMTCAEQKVQAVVDACVDYDHVIWTDDEEVSAALKLYPRLRVLQETGTLLTVQPKSVYGLTPGDLVYIHQWIQGVKSDA